MVEYDHNLARLNSNADISDSEGIKTYSFQRMLNARTRKSRYECVTPLSGYMYHVYETHDAFDQVVQPSGTSFDAEGLCL